MTRWSFGPPGRSCRPDSLTPSRCPAGAEDDLGRPGNRYGHLTLQVIDRLQAVGAWVLHTDLNGEMDVRAREDGSWVVSLQRDPN